MRCSTLVSVALGASTAVAAPAWPEFNKGAAMPGQLETVSEYFNMLARKVHEGRSMSMAPVCDLSKAVIPVAPVPLPGVSKGLTLKHVAIGRGTQNYTCDTTNATAAPVQVGALATLFNASCLAATYPELLHMLPKMALQFQLTEDEAKMGPANMAISGKHFFTNDTTPFFNLNRPALELGEAPCQKLNGTAAPTDAPVGLKGETAVPWLKLLTRDGATGDMQEVYRVETAGGSAPAVCKDQPAEFTVEYAAQYWFYEGPRTVVVAEVP